MNITNMLKLIFNFDRLWKTFLFIECWSPGCQQSSKSLLNGARLDASQLPSKAKSWRWECFNHLLIPVSDAQYVICWPWICPNLPPHSNTWGGKGVLLPNCNINPNHKNQECKFYQVDACDKDSNSMNRNDKNIWGLKLPTFWVNFSILANLLV